MRFSSITHCSGVVKLSKSNKICGIYSITHISSEKQYIGSSIDIYKRWYGHKNALQKNKHVNKKLQNYWNKHGEDSFLFEVIEECEKVKEIILEREQFYIDSLKPVLNICPTAGSHLGFKHTEETKQLMSEAHSGDNNYLFGVVGVDNLFSKTYLIIFPNGEYTIVTGLKEWCRDRELSDSSLSSIARGKYIHHKGYYSEEYYEGKYSEFELNKKSQEWAEWWSEYKDNGRKGEINHRSKKYIVTTPENILIYVHGLTQFCRDNGLDDRSMGRVVSGKRKSHRGYKCEHYIEEKQLEEAA